MLCNRCQILAMVYGHRSFYNQHDGDQGRDQRYDADDAVKLEFHDPSARGSQASVMLAGGEAEDQMTKVTAMRLLPLFISISSSITHSQFADWPALSKLSLPVPQRIPASSSCPRGIAQAVLDSRPESHR